MITQNGHDNFKKICDGAWVSLDACYNTFLIYLLVLFIYFN